MKIVFFIDSLKSGGKERRIVELIKGLLKNYDIQIDLVLMCKEVHFSEILQLDINIFFLIRKNKKDFSIFRKFFIYCKKSKPDIIHCWDKMTLTYALPSSIFDNRKLINSIITNATPKKKLESEYLYAQLSFPFSNKIISNSKAGLIAYNAPNKKSVFIYNGFNFNRFNHLEDPMVVKRKLGIDTKYIIGMVATFSSKKDYKTYFNAAQIILKNRKDVTFLAIGNKTDSSECINLIKENVTNFKFLGNQHDVESIINILDIGILATFYEGISNTIMEYMAAAKPVIATKGGGTSEIVEDNISGFLVPPSDASMLADKINKILTDKNLGFKMGQEGKKKIENNFSIDKMIHSYWTVYRSMVN